MRDSYAVMLCFSKETEAREETSIFPEALDAIAAYREYTPGSSFPIPVRLSKCEIPPFEIDDTRTLIRTMGHAPSACIFGPGATGWVGNMRTGVDWLRKRLMSLCWPTSPP